MSIDFHVYATTPAGSSPDEAEALLRAMFIDPGFTIDGSGVGFTFYVAEDAYDIRELYNPFLGSPVTHYVWGRVNKLELQDVGRNLCRRLSVDYLRRTDAPCLAMEDMDIFSWARTSAGLVVDPDHEIEQRVFAEAGFEFTTLPPPF